jgi:quinol monooxygenase YgiN
VLCAWAATRKKDLLVLLSNMSSFISSSSPLTPRPDAKVLDDLASQGLASVGVNRFDVLQQVDRRSFFALFEIWSSAQTFAACESSSATQDILTSLAPLLEAPG